MELNLLPNFQLFMSVAREMCLFWLFSLNNLLGTKAFHTNILWRRLPLGQGKEVFLWDVDGRAGAYGEIQSRALAGGHRLCCASRSHLEPGLRWHSGQEEWLGQVLQVLWSFSCLKKFRGKLDMPNNVFLSKDCGIASDGCCWEVYIYVCKGLQTPWCAWLYFTKD